MNKLKIKLENIFYNVNKLLINTNINSYINNT